MNDNEKLESLGFNLVPIHKVEITLDLSRLSHRLIKQALVKHKHLSTWETCAAIEDIGWEIDPANMLRAEPPLANILKAIGLTGYNEVTFYWED